MNNIKTTAEVIETLTEHQIEVLRKRFGLPEQHKPLPTQPPNDDEDGGAGGVPAPAPIQGV